MDKRAQVSFHLLQTIPRFIFLILVLFSVVFLVRSYVADNLNVQDVQAEVFSDRILYSPNGILYFDSDLKRAVPGIIDPSKLNDKQLDNLMDYKDGGFIAANISLVDFNGNFVSSGSYNHQTYSRWNPVALAKIPGSGGVKRFMKSIFVNYYEKNTMKQGLLNFEVLLPGN